MTAPQLDLVKFISDRGKRLVNPSYRVGMDIYPHDNDPIFTKRSSNVRRLNWKPDTEGTINQFSWSKRLGQAAGSWSAVAKLGRNATIDPLAGDVMDNDWVDITVNRNGAIFPICRGLVDSVRQKKSTTGGATTRTLMLTGRDHGALFESLVAWNNIFVQTVADLSFGIFSTRIPGGPGDTPDGMFKKLINATFAQGTDAQRSAWQFPPALRTVTGNRIFIEELEIEQGPTRGAFFHEQQLWTGSGQTLHQTISNWCNPLLNTWYYDISQLAKTGKNWPMLATILEKPFVNTTDGESSPFFDLPHWKIPSWMITEDDLGRSGYERFNIYQLLADMHYLKGQDQVAMTPARYSKEQIKRHGLKPFTENTKYIVFGGDGAWEDERRLWQQLMVDWYAPNPYFLSGTATIGCMVPEIQIGSRFTIDTGDPKTSPTFYVEGVDHTFRWAQAGGGPRTSTSLTLTRGFQGLDRDYLKMVQTAAQQYTDVF